MCVGVRIGNQPIIIEIIEMVLKRRRNIKVSFAFCAIEPINYTVVILLKQESHIGDEKVWRC